MEHHSQVRPGDGDRPSRIVLYTLGTIGDLNPMLALAVGLRARGHEPIIATSGAYRPRVESAGIGFRAVRPDFPDTPEATFELMSRMMDDREGLQRIFTELVLPNLRQTYEDSIAAAVGADLLISHPLTLAVPLIAEKSGIPWISTMVQPLGFFSIYDPPVLGMVPGAARLQGLGPVFHKVLFGLVSRETSRWLGPWHALRREIGLPPSPANPVMAGKHSPRLVLGLFSPLFAPKQRDWPPQTVVTGFPFYEPPGGEPLAPEIETFLAEGPPPLLFTLGSAAVMDPGAFYEQSALAAEALGQRAILLTGHEPRNVPARLPRGVAAFQYAPFSKIFPRVALVVHQGGIGTVAEALRSARPMVVVPWAHDQPDNARRVTSLGVARTINRRNYTAATAARAIQELLDDPAVAHRAEELGAMIAAEDGVAVACALIDDELSRIRPAALASV